MRGTRASFALANIHAGKLLLIVYTGTREHYFKMHQEGVERIFSSVELVK